MATKNAETPAQIDYLARDYDSLLEAMYRLIPERMPEWTEYRKQSDFGNVLLQLFAHMGDILSYYQDRIANECFLPTARERRSVIDHLKLIGYRLGTALPAATKLTLAFPEDCNDTVVLKRGDAFATRSTRERPAVRFEYNGPDLTIDCSALQVDPASGTKRFDIDVEEGRLVARDLLGTSDGTPNQRFPLTRPGLILRGLGNAGNSPRDLEVWTELGAVADRDWTLQESLAFSRENQKDYTVEIDEHDQATVVFGGRRFGAAPPAGALVFATYRVGGGAHGNVAALAIDTIAGAPQLDLVSATVFNAQPATGGADRESVEHAKFNAPSVFRSLKRAVTADDYRALALHFNVGKVRASARNWNEVVLHVAPAGGGRVSDVLRANLLAYFEDKRPLSTVIEIEDVDYVKVYVAATVGLESYYSRTEMRKKIEQAVADLLAFENVDFGQVIYLSKFYEALEKLEGVAYVTISEFRRAGETAQVQPEGRIQLAPGELPRLPGKDPDDPAADLAYRAGLRIVALEGGY